MKIRITATPLTSRVRIVGVPKAQTGGKIPETKGLPRQMRHMANVEAEGGEVYQNQNGGFTKISDQAPSHEEGGVMIPDAERVLEDTSTDRKDKYSKMLKMSPNEVHTIFGFKPKSPVSHAKAFELAKKEFDKQRTKFSDAQGRLNDAPFMDKMSVNSAKNNFYNRSQVPTDDDIFDTLFSHQEAIKEVHEIPNDGQARKYGGFRYKMQAGGITPYQGGATSAGSTTPMGNSNKFNYNGGLDAFKQAWGDIGLDLSQYNTAAEAQTATYNWLTKNQPDVAAAIWQQQGLTAKGRQMMDPNSKSYNPQFAKAASNLFDSTGKLKKDANLTPEALQAIAPAYGDNMLGIRSVTPSQLKQTDPNAPAGQVPPQAPRPQARPGNPNVTVNPSFTPRPDNQFHEATHWYDVAPALAETVDAMGRDPELYNPVQLHQLKYKLMNPTAALQANQSDYNAAAEALGEQNIGSGAAAANLSNLTAQKYKANQQIIGQYENQNAGIQNQEITYNTNVRDRQSLADAESREKFYSNVLRARDNQRLQKLQAIQDLSRVQQLKARQNRSGNLIMKMTPAFDENGNYNGYQYIPTLPVDQNMGFIPQTPQKPVKPTSRTTTTFKVGDRTVRTTQAN